MLKKRRVDLRRRTDKAEFLRVHRRGGDQCRIFTRQADSVDAVLHQARNEPLVRAPGETHADDLDVLLAGHATTIDELRAAAERLLECRDFVAAPVHEHETAVVFPRCRQCGTEGGVRLRTPTDLDHSRHSGSPAVSSRPSIRLAFCIA
jgi:hypothetical protein